MPADSKGMSRRQMLQTSAVSLAAIGLSASNLAQAGARSAREGENAMTQNTTSDKPTIVLVHGAFAESNSWDDVISKLRDAGYPVVGLANPLRGVKYDAAYLASFLKSVTGPVVLVGHSYGGMVISSAADPAKVKALVYVSAFAPEPGESAADLSGRFPGSTLGPTLAPPIPLGDGTNDLYIKQSEFRAQFCADIPEAQAAKMAVNQRPCTDLALNEKATGNSAWKVIPSWFIFGELDRNIPVASHRFMAQRAKAREAVEIKGGSHVVGISSADTTANLILRAAAAASAAPRASATT
ncbi:alpha/beta fold hydrolase [Deinococcus pimensis]|uniref:alpha/beta fold hydrolase n=1 Tax=Deinococcus pimensis TaxID=309888 RepID=UPI0004B1000C|nr:alpha/beta hydrolase [Deinococcus pimensis]